MVGATTHYSVARRLSNAPLVHATAGPGDTLTLVQSRRRRGRRPTRRRRRTRRRFPPQGLVPARVIWPPDGLRDFHHQRGVVCPVHRRKQLWRRAVVARREPVVVAVSQLTASTGRSRRRHPRPVRPPSRGRAGSAQCPRTHRSRAAHRPRRRATCRRRPRQAQGRLAWAMATVIRNSTQHLPGGQIVPVLGGPACMQGREPRTGKEVCAVWRLRWRVGPEHRARLLAEWL